MGAAPFPSTGALSSQHHAQAQHLRNSAGQGLSRHRPGGLFSRPHPAPHAWPLCSAHLSCRPSFLKRKPMVRRLRVGGVERTHAR